MTIKELIEELKKYPDDMLVALSDSEYGSEEMSGQLTHIKLTVWKGATFSYVDAIELK